MSHDFKLSMYQEGIQCEEPIIDYFADFDFSLVTRVTTGNKNQLLHVATRSENILVTPEPTENKVLPCVTRVTTQNPTFDSYEFGITPFSG